MGQTAERVSDKEKSDNFVYRRSLFAYEKAAKMISGKVLEVGSGEGYGMEMLSPLADEYTMVDKYQFDLSRIKDSEKVKFIQVTIPPLAGLPDNYFDFVVSFQVIEHIRNDKDYCKEIARVLKPGGKFICTTPNIKMSLARNPWHIREYTVEQLKKLLSISFSQVDTKGVFGKGAAMDYYDRNKASVQKIMKWDVLKLQYRLPGWMLQIPYDYMNRRNRKKLLNTNNDLTSNITTADFELKEASEECLDLFYISTK